MDLSDERDAVRIAVEGVVESTVCQVDDSAMVELANYARHRGVQDLDDDSLERVVTGIGQIAEQVARRGGRERLGGADIRAVVLYLCSQTYGDCSEVARRILAESIALTGDQIDHIVGLGSGDLGGMER
ncbi:MAG: hypothetical protein ABFS34_04765 [Gemmatimonadota bacterium]